MICENMTETQARNNVGTVVEAAFISVSLIADKSGSSYARSVAAKLAEIHLDFLQDKLFRAIFKEARDA